MEFIIDFYKGLDTLNLIIFWGIIIVIVLLLIFSFILMNKNKKLKNIIIKSEKKEELPIKDNIEIKEQNIEQEKLPTLEKEILLPPIPEVSKELIHEQNNVIKPIETEKKFIAEEHVMEYNKDLFALTNIKKTTENIEEKTTAEAIKKSPIEMPTGPYQRNVLREMSLSQTSPIGINRQEVRKDKKIEVEKKIETSLNKVEPEVFSKKEDDKTEELLNKVVEDNKQIKKELTNITDSLARKTEIRTENTLRNRTGYEERTSPLEEVKTNPQKKLNTNVVDFPKKEPLNTQTPITTEEPIKKSSEKYLEEVSRKLAEAEIPDEIERTNYELQQEEDAIISYKELMEKKDSIQTIDEEEAIISIEELINRNNSKQDELKEKKETSKLYNLSEEEENDNFIKELKQFRNDL